MSYIPYMRKGNVMKIKKAYTQVNPTVTMDSIDRIVYMEVFMYVQNPEFTLENNPYKQGTVSYLAWVEGIEYRLTH